MDWGEFIWSVLNIFISVNLLNFELNSFFLVSDSVSERWCGPLAKKFGHPWPRVYHRAMGTSVFPEVLQSYEVLAILTYSPSNSCFNVIVTRIKHFSIFRNAVNDFGMFFMHSSVSNWACFGTLCNSLPSSTRFYHLVWGFPHVLNELPCSIRNTSGSPQLQFKMKQLWSLHDLSALMIFSSIFLTKKRHWARLQGATLGMLQGVDMPSGSFAFCHWVRILRSRKLFDNFPRLLCFR